MSQTLRLRWFLAIASALTISALNAISSRIFLISVEFVDALMIVIELSGTFS